MKKSLVFSVLKLLISGTFLFLLAVSCYQSAEQAPQTGGCEEPPVLKSAA